MPFSALITRILADRTELQKQLKMAEQDLAAFYRRAHQLGRVNIGGMGPAAGAVPGVARLSTIGAVTENTRRGRQRRAETEEETARRFLNQAYRDAGNQVLKDAKERSRKERENQKEEERARRELLASWAADARQARVRERVRRRERREEVEEAGHLTRFFGLPSREREASQRMRETREAANDDRRRRREQRREFVQQSRDFARDLKIQDDEEKNRKREEQSRKQQQRREFTQQSRDFARDLKIGEQERKKAESGRITDLRTQSRAAIAAGIASPIGGFGRRFGGGAGGGGGGGGDDINRLSRVIGNNLAGAFDRATRAAGQLNLLVGTSVLGGFGALVAEGFRLNAQLEKVNITMAATLGVTNDVVDAQSKLVEGPQRTNFLLRGTAGLFEQIRKEAAATILEQQELIETVGENLTLAQQAGFKLTELGGKQTEVIVKSISQIAQLAKAVGLPGGQRQLSQEVRALFLGERLQGATVARLLGFSDIGEIKRLQARPGREEGTTAFVDELTERFERAKPILDEFAQSATGIFTTLISQARLFLQVASEAAFEEVVGAGRNLRDFLTDERVRTSAREIGASFGRMVRSVIEFGRSPAAAGLFAFLRFLVDNASTIISVLVAFRGLRAVQTVSSALGGLGRGAGGAIGAGAAGAAGGAAGGLLGRLAGGRALGTAAAGGGIAARLGLLGRVGGAAAGIGTALGLTGATLATGTLLAGLGIGSLANFLATDLPQQLGTNAGRQTAPEFTRPDRARVAERLIRTREQRLRVERMARDLERRGAAARSRQPELSFFERLAVGTPSIGEFFGRQPIRERFRRLEVPELTDRFTPGGLRERSAELAATGTQQRQTAQEAQNLELRKREAVRRQEMLKARLALAEVTRDREAQLKIQAKLDQDAIITEFEDRKAQAIRLIALNRQLTRDLRELREDERLQSQEILAQSLQDEEQVIRIRIQRERNEAQRRIRDTEQLASTLAAIELRGRRELMLAFVSRQGERAGARAQLAELEGRTLDQRREQGRQLLADAARLRIEEKISTEEFNRFRRAIIKKTADEEIKERRRIRNEALDLTQQVTDIARRSSELQRDYERQRIQFAERVADRERALNRARLADINAITKAQQTQREVREDAENVRAQSVLRSRAFNVLRTGAEEGPIQGRSIEEQVQFAIRQQVTDEMRDLTQAQQAEEVRQRTQAFMTQLVDEVLGGGGVAGAQEQLAGLGIRLDRGELQGLTNLTQQAGRERVRVTEQQGFRQFVAQEAAGVEADQALAQAQEQRVDTERENRRAVRDERIERQRIEDDFRQAQVNLAIEFGRTKISIQELAEAAHKAGIALNEGIVNVFRSFLGAKVPAAEVGAAAEAKRQLERAGAPRRRGETPDKNKRSDAGTTINFNLSGMQIGADTRETLETLGQQLLRDSRRTTPS